MFTRALGVVLLWSACSASAQPRASEPPPGLSSTAAMGDAVAPSGAAAPRAVPATPLVTSALPHADEAVPVFTIGDRRYLEVTAWLAAPAMPAGDLVQWGRGPVTSSTFLQQAALGAPPAWRAVIGAAVPAFDAAGKRCAAQLGELALIGFASPGIQDLEGASDVVLAAEVLAPGCTPVLVTNRPSPTFFVAAAPLPPADERRVMASLRGLAPAWTEEPPVLARFVAGARTLVLATFEHFEHREDHCGGTSRGFRALFELPSTGAPRLLGTSSETFGEAPLIAVVDSDGDGAIELIYGGAYFDTGGDLERDLVSTLTLSSSPADTQRLHLRAYGGCD